MILRNSTVLSTTRLEDMILPVVEGWPHEPLRAFIRNSRGAEFSGACYYHLARIHVNLGRRNTYPYLIRVSIARAQSDRRSWWREVYAVRVADAYQLALFVFLHEFYHWLVKKARRNTRQKESRCDRFATAVLVDRYAAEVLDSAGRRVPREQWDFQDQLAFVAAARGRGRYDHAGAATAGPTVAALRPPDSAPLWLRNHAS